MDMDSDAYERLLYAVRMGKMFHGSPDKIDILKPHQATCLCSAAGNQYGVYATRNHLVAVAAALIRPTGPWWQSNWSGDNHELRVWGTNIELGPGFVYLLPPVSFEQLREDNGELSSQYLAREEVLPVGVVCVSPRLLPALNIKVDL